jgi:His-Xaa-Ser system protein HxsD
MSRLQFNRKLYSKTALLKAAYFFTDSAYIHLDADDSYYYVEITPKNSETNISEDEFVNEMLVQSVRHEVYMQTKNIRELLLARALSTSMITDRKSMEDDLKKDDKFNEDSILKDWFDSNET